MAVYSNIFVVLNGEVLAEAVTVETVLEKSSTEVYSLANGFEGITSGPLVRRIDVSNVIPASANVYPEFEFMMFHNQEGEMMLQEASEGRRVVVRGHITSVSRSSSVGSTADLSFSFVGKGTPFW